MGFQYLGWAAPGVPHIPSWPHTSLASGPAHVSNHVYSVTGLPIASLPTEIYPPGTIGQPNPKGFTQSPLRSKSIPLGSPLHRGQFPSRHTANHPKHPRPRMSEHCAKAPHLCIGRGGRVSREEPAPTGYAAPVRQHAHALGAVRRIHERSARWLPRADDLGPHATKAHAVAPAPGLPYDTRNVPSVSLQKAREVCLVP